MQLTGVAVELLLFPTRVFSYLSIYLSIHPSIYLSIYLVIYQSIYYPELSLVYYTMFVCHPEASLQECVKFAREEFMIDFSVFVL